MAGGGSIPGWGECRVARVDGGGGLATGPGRVVGLADGIGGGRLGVFVVAPQSQFNLAGARRGGGRNGQGAHFMKPRNGQGSPGDHKRN